MSKKHKESDLMDNLNESVDSCSEEVYKFAFLTSYFMIVGLVISPDDVEWDIRAEREKFEPADTN